MMFARFVGKAVADEKKENASIKPTPTKSSSAPSLTSLSSMSSSGSATEVDTLLVVGDEDGAGGVGGEGTPARRKYARALYDFDAERDDDLSLRPGDVLEVLSDEGAWWVGVLGERHGHFPSNFVEEYIPPEPLEPPPQFGRQMSSLI